MVSVVQILTTLKQLILLFGDFLWRLTVVFMLQISLSFKTRNSLSDGF